MKKLIAFVLVAVLLLQALPMAGAANDAEREGPDRSGQFIVVKTVFLLDSNGSSPNIIMTLSPGAQVTGAINYWNRTSSNLIQVTYGSYTGYVIQNCICPKNKCYKVTNASGTELWKNAGGSGVTFGSLNYGTYLYRESIVSGWYKVYPMTGAYTGFGGFVSPSDVSAC